MPTNEWYQLGQQLRRSLVGGNQPGVPQAGGGGSSSAVRYEPGSTPGHGQDRPAGVFGIFSHAARLKPGHLLLVMLGKLACYQVDPESGAIEYICSLGHEQSPFIWRALVDRDGFIYCTMSGVKDPGSPTRDAIFGMAGAVLRIDHRHADIQAIATGATIVDPCGMQLVDNGQLLVCDFNGFGGSGQVYLVDPTTGEARTVAEGGLLKDPVSAFRDEDGVIWVANSYMHYEYPLRGGV